MPGDSCVVCGNSRKKAPKLSYHRFPTNQVKRSQWLRVFQLDPEVVKPHTRVCSRHFMNGDPINDPQANIGRRFASPIKKGSDRTTRAIERQCTKRNLEIQSLLTASSLANGSSSDSSMSSSRVLCSSSNTSDDHLPAVTKSPAEAMERDEEPMTALVGEQLLGDYQVIDLPDDGSTAQACSATDQPLVTTALLARIEFLEAECSRLQNSESKILHFGIDQIKLDNCLVSFYTGFPSFAIFLAFFQFLGPVVDKLQYWGGKQSAKKRQRAKKLTPMDQLFMTLVKLRLDLKVVDIAFRFNISTALVSRYFTTWICFCIII